MSDTEESLSSERVAFTVDTHLLRELGSLLVGRDSTALVELIKNAYDADATAVVVHGERLSDHGFVTIKDDGHGMSHSDFVSNFLRIAGRSKESGARRSPEWHRKYTGAKGIGRLAAHKLGSNLTLESTPRRQLPMGPRQWGVQARIDWEALESNEASMQEAKDVEVRRVPVTADTPQGTLLTINRLHSEWSTRQLNAFLSEVRSTRADPSLIEPIPQDVVTTSMLLPRINVADSSPDDPGFRLELSGEFAGSDSQWPTLLAQVNWILEVDATDEVMVRYRISPTRTTLGTFKDAVPRDFFWRRKTQGPRFASRVFLRGGVGANAASRAGGLTDLLDRFAQQASGVRIFFEGFRVLPYGSARNDWLGLDEAYSRRESLRYLEDFDDLPRAKNDERIYQLRNANHFGAVFLHDKDAGRLQMVVNREGFLPGDDFDQIVEVMRRGLNLGVRVRAALGAAASERRELEKAYARSKLVEEIHDKRQGDDKTRTSTTRRESSTARFDALVTAGRDAAAQLRANSSNLMAKQNVNVIEAALDEARALADASRDEQSQLRVLASLGTQVGAFVHEVNGLLGQARIVRDSIDRLIAEGGATSGMKTRWRQVSRAQNELVASLERQAVYLADSIGAEARRRRVRVRVEDSWNTATRLLGDAARRRRVILINQLPDNLKSPPIFPAELNVILTNLLSNAIKAAAQENTDPERTVRIHGGTNDLGTFIQMENTGLSVDLSEGDRWFRPFESSTSELDSALGQGLGLGLSLTRRIIEEYGGTIEFVHPAPEMATSIRVTFPAR